MNDVLDICKAVTISAAPGERAELTSTNGAVYVNAPPATRWCCAD